MILATTRVGWFVFAGALVWIAIWLARPIKPRRKGFGVKVGPFRWFWWR